MALLLEYTDQVAENEPSRTTFRRFIPYVKPYIRSLCEIFLASLVMSLFGLASPLFTQTICGSGAGASRSEFVEFDACGDGCHRIVPDACFSPADVSGHLYEYAIEHDTAFAVLPAFAIVADAVFRFAKDG